MGFLFFWDALYSIEIESQTITVRHLPRLAQPAERTPMHGLMFVIVY